MSSWKRPPTTKATMSIQELQPKRPSKITKDNNLFQACFDICRLGWTDTICYILVLSLSWLKTQQKTTVPVSSLKVTALQTLAGHIDSFIGVCELWYWAQPVLSRQVTRADLTSESLIRRVFKHTHDSFIAALNLTCSQDPTDVRRALYVPSNKLHPSTKAKHLSRACNTINLGKMHSQRVQWFCLWSSCL